MKKLAIPYKSRRTNRRPVCSEVPAAEEENERHKGRADHEWAERLRRELSTLFDLGAVPDQPPDRGKCRCRLRLREDEAVRGERDLLERLAAARIGAVGLREPVRHVDALV